MFQLRRGGSSSAPAQSTTWGLYHAVRRPANRTETGPNLPCTLLVPAGLARMRQPVPLRVFARLPPAGDMHSTGGAPRCVPAPGGQPRHQRGGPEPGRGEPRGAHMHVDEQHLRALPVCGRQLALRARGREQARAALRQRRRVVHRRVHLAGPRTPPVCGLLMHAMKHAAQAPGSGALSWWATSPACKTAHERSPPLSCWASSTGSGSGASRGCRRPRTKHRAGAAAPCPASGAAS